MEIAPPGAAVQGVVVDRADGSLHLELEKDRTSFDLAIPAPWTFSSCLLSVSSAPAPDAENKGAPGDGGDSAPIASTDLIGLEGATLSGIESGTGRLELVFESIRISVFDAGS